MLGAERRVQPAGAALDGEALRLQAAGKARGRPGLPQCELRVGVQTQAELGQLLGQPPDMSRDRLMHLRRGPPYGAAPDVVHSVSSSTRVALPPRTAAMSSSFQ